MCCLAHRRARASSGTLAEASIGSDSVSAVTLVATSHSASSDCWSAVGRLGLPAALGCPERPGLARLDYFGPDIIIACLGLG